MPIGSYPRITLQNTSDVNNNKSGTGLAIFNQESDRYEIADSNLFPLNNGGIGNQNTLQTVANNLVANSDDSTAGDNLADIRTTLSLIYSGLANGSFAIQIQASNSTDRAHLTANRLDVRVG